jgi:hypothetical protein
MLKQLNKLALITLLALVCTAPSLLAKDIKVKEIKEYKFISKEYYFTFEDFNHPELVALLKKERIDEVTKPGMTEFDKILLVKSWVHKQLNVPGVASSYPPWNAAVVLDWVRKNKVQVLCGHYAVVFAQIMTGLGIPARYIDLSSAENEGHFVVEVWSNDFNKWVLMDPYQDQYYQLEGMPLSALDLHLAFVNEKPGDIMRIQGKESKKIDKPEQLKLFYNFDIVLRNNHVSDPVNMFDIVMQVSPNVMVKHMWDDSRVRYEGKLNRALFYWEPNVCVIAVKEKDPEKGTVTLMFKSLVHNADKFLVLEADDYKVAPSEFVWKLKEGFNELTVRPLNNGMTSQSYIGVDYEEE